MSKVKEYGLAERQTKKSRLLLFYLAITFMLLIVGMSFATQKIAFIYSYHPALGKPLTSAFGMFWYWPWSVFSWELPDHRAVDDAIFHAQMLFAIPQLVLIFLCISATQKLKGNKDLHGSARWAKKEDIERAGLFSDKGVYVGGWMERQKGKEIQHYLRHNGPEHILCFAPTRSGKGVGLILPTLLAWEGSSVVLDLKGENWALTSGWRKSQGHTVLKFDPTDESGNSAAFNPLEELPINTLKAIPSCQNMASMLIDPEGKGLADHWSKAAFAFFSGVLLHCCVKTLEEQNRFATLRDLILLMADETRDTAALLEEMLEMDHAAILKKKFSTCSGGEEAHSFIASSAREMMNKSVNEASGVLSSASVNFALYQDPVVAINTSRSDFRLHDIMNSENPVDLYLVIPSTDVDRLKPLTRLIMDMIVRHVCAKMEFADGASVAGYKHRCLLLMDEFTSQGKIPIFEKGIGYIAGYGGKMFLIVQDMAQLQKEYGKDNEIFGNCHIKIAYAPNKMETAQLLSDMTGKATVVEKKKSISKSRGGRSVSINISETARPLLTPDECMRLPGISKDKNGDVVPGDMLIFVAGNNPIYGKQILYFRDPEFSERAKIPAPDVTDSISNKVEIFESQPGLTQKPEIKEERFDYESFLKQ